VPEQAKKEMEFFFVSTMDEVLELALESWPPKTLLSTASPSSGSAASSTKEAPIASA
jgi:hypothetical protein